MQVTENEMWKKVCQCHGSTAQERGYPVRQMDASVCLADIPWDGKSRYWSLMPFNITDITNSSLVPIPCSYSLGNL